MAMQQKCFVPGALWLDDHGVFINAHGGGFLDFDGTVYWYGEHKIEGEMGNRAYVGVHVYSSQDLYSWRDCGLALDIRYNRIPELPPGCIIERPKVLYNRKTRKFVMYFHYDDGKSYTAAAVGVAVADSPAGPFTYLGRRRPSAGVWPLNTPEECRDPERIRLALAAQKISGGANDLTPRISLLGAHLSRGQDSRDMTLFQDDDGTAYLIHASEGNSTLHIVELSDDYLSETGRYARAFPNRWMEAPALFKKEGKYYLFASDCTGWAPNAARSAVADHIFGPWTELGNPAVDAEAETTYRSQPAGILNWHGRLIYAGDRWTPQNAIDGRYVWLPITFENGRLVIHWHDRWSLT